ncbi:MAG: nucleotidyltransferase family protein [Clostridia bacterium]|nr:nucleotidyltransferase family protein [Clostridia bacterium]
MKNEEILLLALLQASFNKEKLTNDIVASLNDESLAKVLSLSARHSVTTLVADVLLTNDLLDDGELKAAYEENLMVSVYQYHQQAMEFKRICNLFEENGIDYIPLKGSVLRSLYREPWLRTCCDVDILVKPEQLDAAIELVLTCGYTFDKHYSHDVSFFTEGNMRVELHFDLIEEEHNICHVCDVLKDAWQYAHLQEGTKHTYQFEPELFYFYQLAHMTKHFLHGGCGIRSVIDIWLLRRHWQFNDEKNKMFLQKGGITVFEEKINALAAAWFDDAEKPEEIISIENYIFTGGIYGSRQNSMAMENVENGTRLRNTIAKIFLKYSVMKYYYPVLQKHKWLLPFYEVKRWCKLIFFKEHRDRSLTYLKEIRSFPDSRAKESMALLLQLDLKKESD